MLLEVWKFNTHISAAPFSDIVIIVLQKVEELAELTNWWLENYKCYIFCMIICGEGHTNVKCYNIYMHNFVLQNQECLLCYSDFNNKGAKGVWLNVQM